MVDAFFDLIVQSLIDGKDVKLSGFGNFQIGPRLHGLDATPYRGRDPDRGPARGHLSRQQQTQGADTKAAPLTARREPFIGSPRNLRNDSGDAAASAVR